MATRKKRKSTVSNATKEAAMALFTEAYTDFLTSESAKTKKVAKAAYKTAIEAGWSKRALFEWAGEGMYNIGGGEMIESVGMWFEKA